MSCFFAVLLTGVCLKPNCCAGGAFFSSSSRLKDSTSAIPSILCMSIANVVATAYFTGAVLGSKITLCPLGFLFDNLI